MIAPWRNWCRLCANPNGDVPILHSGGQDHYVNEKIKRYLSISFSEEDKLSCLLCSKCCDRLRAFDEYVHHCLQVQTMFGALTELLEIDIPEDRLIEIRNEFLPSEYDVYNGNNHNGIVLSSQAKKKISLETRDQSNVQIKGENGGCRRSMSPVTRRKDAEISESNVTSCLKNGRSRAAVDLKQAFAADSELLDETLDSDFNEETFGNLLDADDDFQPVLRNSASALKMKDTMKQSENSFGIEDTKPSPLVESSRRNKSDKSCVKDKMSSNDMLVKREDVLKSRNGICNSAINSDGLTTDGNGTCVNTLSETDLNDYICDENSTDNVSDDSGDKEIRTHETWRSLEKNKTVELSKVANESQEKLYELSQMLVESANEAEADCPVPNGWIVNKTSEKKLGGKKKNKLKDQVPLKCDQCDKSFYRKALLNSHLISHVPKDQQPFVCCKCARRFHCEALLRNHERSHLPSEEKRVYPCDACDKKFSTRSAVTAHMKAIHYGERPFVCHLCGHSFSSKGILQEHLTIHSDEEPWHCSKCSKRFKTKYRLKIHMDTHRETPYSCPHCPTQLSTRRTLRMHLVVHRDTKAYQCAVCGKAFRRAKDLKNHHNLHTGKRPYTCPFCSRTFANGSNCRSHKRRMHPEELRLYEAALAGNGGIDPVNNSTPLETENGSNTMLGSQDLEEDGNQPLKEDSQDSLLTEMALDLQQPQIISDKSDLTTVDEDPVVTAADLTLAPLVTLSSTLPKLEPDDSRLVMNLTTQMHDTHDSMEAMSPLNLNIMSPMNLNISSPLNLNISSPLNLNISSVLHSPTSRNQPQHSMTSQHPQNTSRYQLPHQNQPQLQHLSVQPTQHQTHQQLQHHQQLSHQPQLHQQMHQQQVPRSSLQVGSLQTPLGSHGVVHSLTSLTQLPAHINNTVHHTPQLQTYVPLNQQGTMYNHQTVQDSVSSAALVAAAAVAHSMTTSSSTTLPPFSGSPYVQHSMVYGRNTNM